MSILETILRSRRSGIEHAKKEISEDRLRERPLFARKSLSLLSALQNASPAVIAEVKKASPSRGVIRQDFDPVSIAREYAGAGANAISVLTEEEFFKGSIQHLEAIRAEVSLPLLRKDFIVDPYQLTEAKAFGADAVLLIAAALSVSELADLSERCQALDLEYLVEVHTQEDLRRLRGVRCPLVGINNRDLATFRTDLAVSFELAPLLGPGTICVSESGIRSREDVERLAAAGIHAILVGEHLMESPRPAEALSRLLAAAPVRP
ncbi:MAG TPA: indole-3-glycerol phosphate synthase TrpC [Bacteroidota bacterium]|nr:indole-3-glycerol phosphate synthase TrpC [Bacteroidota bacterium]